MLIQIFTVYDSKAEAYLQPFYMATKGQAVRAFTDMANDPNHSFYKHPEDYTLFHLGQYEDARASFHLQKTPAPIGKAIEFKTVRELPLGDARLDLADSAGGVA